VDSFNDPAVIAVWERVDEFEPEAARIFTGEEYADWAETNHLADTFPWPVRFYSVTATGVLTELDHQVRVSPYDEDDYATVTHTWRRRLTDSGNGQEPVYTTGTARRDGRA
jgi:hypothetical protein